MSRCAHLQSTYKLRKLPKCSRCNNEFILVCAAYEKTSGYRYEWECQKCHKTIPKESLREEPLSPEDQWLQNWCKENGKREARQKENDKEYRTQRASD